MVIGGVVVVDVASAGLGGTTHEVVVITEYIESTNTITCYLALYIYHVMYLKT